MSASATSNRVRVAVIGCGRMANKVHYPSLADLKDVEVAAICDIDSTRLNDTANKYGIEKRYLDYRKMVEDVAPEAVCAIGQPNIMYDIWVWCLEQGLHLFMEKPPGLSIYQARSLAYLAEKNGCITQVGFQRRATPMVVMLREECLKRGPITHAVCRFYKHSMDRRVDAKGHLMDDGTHVIDTLRWMCGGEVSEIHSISKSVLTSGLNFFSALLQFDNGATGIMLNSYTSGRRIFDVEIHAPGIYIQAEHEGKGHIYADGDYEGVEYDAREFAGSDEVYIFRGHLAKHREFIDCVKSGEQPESCLADALKTKEQKL